MDSPNFTFSQALTWPFFDPNNFGLTTTCFPKGRYFPFFNVPHIYLQTNNESLSSNRLHQSIFTLINLVFGRLALQDWQGKESLPLHRVLPEQCNSITLPGSNVVQERSIRALTNEMSSAIVSSEHLLWLPKVRRECIHRVCGRHRLVFGEAVVLSSKPVAC